MFVLCILKSSMLKIIVNSNMTKLVPILMASSSLLAHKCCLHLMFIITVASKKNKFLHIFDISSHINTLSQILILSHVLVGCSKNWATTTQWWAWVFNIMYLLFHLKYNNNNNNNNNNILIYIAFIQSFKHFTSDYTF